MKTSFYFVLWISIYPLLDLINSAFIDNHIFLLALIIIGSLSWVLNKIMPNTLSYEKIIEVAPILENVYRCNVTKFYKRLSRQTGIEIVASIYFIVSTAVIGMAVLKYGVDDWFALIVFGLFSYGSISRSVNLSKARSSLKENPTSEQCLEIVEETYKLDYTSYYEDRQYITYEGLFLPIPRYFKAFLIFSIIFSSLSILFGLFYIIIAGILVLSQPTLDIAAIGGMYLLYGSLAIYFGIKDTVTIIKNLKFISEISHLKETTRFH